MRQIPIKTRFLCLRVGTGPEDSMCKNKFDPPPTLILQIIDSAVDEEFGRKPSFEVEKALVSLDLVDTIVFALTVA